MQVFPLIIDGHRIPTPQCFEVLNPATEDVAGLAPLASTSHVDDAIAAAGRALARWELRAGVSGVVTRRMGTLGAANGHEGEL